MFEWAHVCVDACEVRVCLWKHVWARVLVRVCGCVGVGACVGSRVNAFVGECVWVRVCMCLRWCVRVRVWVVFCVCICACARACDTG